MKILWNNNGVYQNVEDWPMPSDANIIYLYTLALMKDDCIPKIVLCCIGTAQKNFINLAAALEATMGG